jgi:O-antigen/teichoic acid export membrane protein
MACLAGPPLLGAILPRYAEGLVALRPLAPGMTLLALSWPARQAMIAVGRPYRLGLATLAGAAVTAAAGAIGAARGGLVGVAWGMSVGYASVYFFTSLAAFLPVFGRCRYLGHELRVFLGLGWLSAGVAALVSTAPASGLDVLPQCGLLVLWSAPLFLANWRGWGGPRPCSTSSS